MDGGGIIQVPFLIMLSLLKPALTAVALSIISHWNDWFSGLIHIWSPLLYALQTYLLTQLRDFETILRMAQGDIALLLSMMNARTGRAAQLLLDALALMLIDPLLQKSSRLVRLWAASRAEREIAMNTSSPDTGYGRRISSYLWPSGSRLPSRYLRMTRRSVCYNRSSLILE